LQTPSTGAKAAKTQVHSSKTPTPAGAKDYLGDYVTHSLLRRLSVLTPEVIARLGVRWHNAHNKTAIASIIRYHLVYNDVDGLAESYDSLRDKSPKAELNLLNRWVRSGQHAARGHREKVAEIISSLFKDTPHDEALVHVKKSVFNVDGGSAIMSPNHPAIIELLSQPKGDTASFVPLLNVTCRS